MAKPSANRQAPEDLTEQQLACIESLLAGSTKREAAEAVGCSPSTLSQWMQEPGFIAQLNSRRADLHEANTERLRSLAQKALEVLTEALESDDEKVRLSASRQVLKALKLAEIEPPAGPLTADDVRRYQKKQALIQGLTGGW